MVEKIGDVVGFIDAIAQQTSLLALDTAKNSLHACEAEMGPSDAVSDVRESASKTNRIRTQGKAARTEMLASANAIREASAVVEHITSIVIAIASASEVQGQSARQILHTIQGSHRKSAGIADNICEPADISCRTSSRPNVILNAAGRLSETAYPEDDASLSRGSGSLEEELDQ